LRIFEKSGLKDEQLTPLDCRTASLCEPIRLRDWLTAVQLDWTAIHGWPTTSPVCATGAPDWLTVVTDDRTDLPGIPITWPVGFTNPPGSATTSPETKTSGLGGRITAADSLTALVVAAANVADDWIHLFGKGF
jgi:hypothetical protein